MTTLSPLLSGAPEFRLVWYGRWPANNRLAAKLVTADGAGRA